MKKSKYKTRGRPRKVISTEIPKMKPQTNQNKKEPKETLVPSERIGYWADKVMSSVASAGILSLAAAQAAGMLGSANPDKVECYRRDLEKIQSLLQDALKAAVMGEDSDAIALHILNAKQIINRLSKGETIKENK